MVFQALIELTNTLLDPILGPLLNLPPFWTLFVLTLVVSLGLTLAQKYLTDQERMRHLRNETKKHQEKLKKHRDDPKKAMKIQQEMMSHNMELMKHSFRPMLFTFLPIIIFFGWLSANLGYYNIAPGEDFTLNATYAEGFSGSATLSVIPNEVSIQESTKQIVDRETSWSLSGPAGTYKASIDAGGQSVNKTFLITEKRDYINPEEIYPGAIEKVTVGNRVVRPLGNISLFGWHPGWFGTYFLLSVLMSITLRKLFNVV